MALAVSAGASAAPVGMTIGSITGSYDVYLGTFTNVPNPPAWPLALGTASVPNAQAVLNDAGGNANWIKDTPNVGPGGNVELGKYGSQPPTQMVGDFNGKSITLRGLQYEDWAMDGKALGYRYIGGFNTAYNLGLNPTQIKGFVDILVPDAPPQPNAVPVGWQRLSDPNISYVYLDGHTVNIGLAGFWDIERLLETALGGNLPNRPVDSPYQASEVVHVCLGSAPCDYLFGFKGTPSGVVGPDGFSYTANYNVTIPEPESLALLGAGLLGVFLGRRRRV